MSVPHPIPYQGSKRRIAPQIIRYVPAGTGALLEPFAGSAAVATACAWASRASQFVLNDINTPLMHLWRSILERPDDVADRYERLWKEQQGQERAHYDRVREQFNATHEPVLLLYLLARCVKASVRYNSRGDFNQSPDNRRKGMHPRTMRDNIRRASALLGGRTVVHSVDFREIALSARDADVVYMDPPYQGVCGQRDPRYVTGLSRSAFAHALALLNEKGVSYIVSYDGRTGDKSFGEPLPSALGLVHMEVGAGRSSQATLLGRALHTVESLYLSPALVERLDASILEQQPQQQLLCGVEDV